MPGLIGAIRPTDRTPADFRAARIARIRADIDRLKASLDRLGEELNGLIIEEAVEALKEPCADRRRSDNMLASVPERREIHHVAPVSSAQALRVLPLIP